MILCLIPFLCEFLCFFTKFDAGMDMDGCGLGSFDGIVGICSRFGTLVFFCDVIDGGFWIL